VTRTRTRLAALSLLALAPLSALSGCGQSPLHPGAAAVVGDETLSSSDLNGISQDLCSVLKTDPQSIGTGYARSQLMSSVVQAFMLRAVADQMAEEYGVTPDKSYATTAVQTRQHFGEADPDALDNSIDTLTSTGYFLAVVGAAGRQELEAAGTPQPSDDQSVGKGIQLAQKWQDEHDIVVSPRFPSVKIGDKGIESVRDDTSYAVSDFAKLSSTDQPDKTYVASLPAAQVCR
jgi:predicted small lipoprotein YifL